MFESIFIGTSAVLATVYGGLMLACYRAWHSIPEADHSVAEERIPAETAAIIVPARNEAEHIENCLAGLLAQQPKPAGKVLLVDDHSTDATTALAQKMALRQPSLHSLMNTGEGKKAAIATGIAATEANWLLVTDADCTHQPRWMAAMLTAAAKPGTAFVAGPVHLRHRGGLLSLFQVLDFMMMQGVTAAAAYRRWMSMCNGANLAYSRQAFEAVGGFSGIDRVPTGDDMLLMYKIARQFPQSTTWLRDREAIVYTEPCSSWRTFLQQRIRWGSKATIFDDRRIFWVLVAVYLFNFCLLAGSLAAVWLPGLRLPMAIFWGIKIAVEIPLMWSVAAFFGERHRVAAFIPLQPLHVVYMVVAGWLGQVSKYQWKGRTVPVRPMAKVSESPQG